jgi:hypothetical protein
VKKSLYFPAGGKIEDPRHAGWVSISREPTFHLSPHMIASNSLECRRRSSAMNQMGGFRPDAGQLSAVGRFGAMQLCIARGLDYGKNDKKA